MADCLRCLQVENEFKSRWLLDWNVGGLGTTQHFNGDASALTIHFRKAGTIGN